jgi:hypothetical protein
MLETPLIYEDLVTELGINPSDKFVEPETPGFTIQGYKRRKALAGATNRVLRDAGFTVGVKA